LDFAGRWFLRNQGQNMSLSASSQHFRSLLAVPFLAAMLAFPANAETSPNGASAQAESNSANAQTDPNAAPAEPDAVQADPNAAPGQPKTSILVNIDKSSQEMTVFVDGVEQYSWPVSTGRPGYSTPSGTYAATSMNEIWYSKEWDNSPMPHAIFFMKDGHAIHGTHEVKNLGKPASHGCVRLSPQNAATLYALVEKSGMENVQVVLSGTTPGGEGAQVASPGKPPKGYEYPWYDPSTGYYEQPQPQRRRGLFGRRWFQPDGPQGYYAPRGNYRYQPRSVSPRGY
jgi:lipoprotein-anchoring transpeptidase ErfK/SrfK